MRRAPKQGELAADQRQITAPVPPQCRQRLDFVGAVPTPVVFPTASTTRSAAGRLRGSVGDGVALRATSGAARERRCDRQLLGYSEASRDRDGVAKSLK